MTDSSVSSTDLGWLLNAFAGEVAGVTHAVAVSADGLLLASTSDLPRDRGDQLAAIAAGLASLTTGAADCLGAAPVLQTIVEMNGGLLLLMAVGDGSLLTVLATRNCDIGQVAYETALLAERARRPLTPTPRNA